jgi:4a-hydroxytetrahydrobiopterin dehydratase
VAVLTGNEREAALAGLDGWRFDEARNGIVKGFAFADFSEAFAFMTRVALAAETADHHPEWANVWNKVDVLLSTHDAGGVTGKDIALAAKIDAIAG